MDKLQYGGEFENDKIDMVGGVNDYRIAGAEEQIYSIKSAFEEYKEVADAYYNDILKSTEQRFYGHTKTRNPTFAQIQLVAELENHYCGYIQNGGFEAYAVGYYLNACASEVCAHMNQDPPYSLHSYLSECLNRCSYAHETKFYAHDTTSKVATEHPETYPPPRRSDNQYGRQLDALLKHPAPIPSQPGRITEICKIFGVVLNQIMADYSPPPDKLTYGDFTIEAIYGYIILKIHEGVFNPALMGLLPHCDQAEYDAIIAHLTGGGAPPVPPELTSQVEVMQKLFDGGVQLQTMTFQAVSGEAQNYIRNLLPQIHQIYAYANNQLASCNSPMVAGSETAFDDAKKKVFLAIDNGPAIGKVELTECARLMAFTPNILHGDETAVKIRDSLDYVHELYKNLYDVPVSEEMRANNFLYKVLSAEIYADTANLSTFTLPVMTVDDKQNLFAHISPLDRSTASIFAELDGAGLNHLDNYLSVDNQRLAKKVLHKARCNVWRNPYLRFFVNTKGVVGAVGNENLGVQFIRYVPEDDIVGRRPSFRWEEKGKPKTVALHKCWVDYEDSQGQRKGKGNGKFKIYEMNITPPTQSNPNGNIELSKPILEFETTLTRPFRAIDLDIGPFNPSTHILQEPHQRLIHVNSTGNPIPFFIEDCVDIGDIRCPYRYRYMMNGVHTLAQIQRQCNPNTSNLEDNVIGGEASGTAPSNEKIFPTKQTEKHHLFPWFSSTIILELLKNGMAVIQKNNEAMWDGELLDGNITMQEPSKATMLGRSVGLTSPRLLKVRCGGNVPGSGVNTGKINTYNYVPLAQPTTALWNSIAFEAAFPKDKFTKRTRSSMPWLN